MYRTMPIFADSLSDIPRSENEENEEEEDRVPSR